jgi:oligopeptidase B
VPFVDVVTTMLDRTLPLTVPEYLEWGDPNIAKYYRYMLSYAPYDNLKNAPTRDAGRDLPQRQPGDVLGAGEVRGQAARLKTDSNPLLLKTIMEAGHGGASGRYDALKELAFTYSFVLDQVGLAR